MNRKLSNIDELFFELYGYYPQKDGQAYEMLVAAALKLLQGKDVSYNQMIRGTYSDTIYQADVLIGDVNEGEMVEAKDYTINGSKVGRGDLQKLQGALTDLQTNLGLFASATDYTAPAKKYASASKVNPMQKQIDLYNIRPSTMSDEEGRIKQITIGLSAHSPDYENAVVEPVFTSKAIKELTDDLGNQQLTLKIDTIYKSNGLPLMTIYDITLNNQPTIDFERNDYSTEGCWITVGGNIMVENKLYEIHGFKYKVNIVVNREEIVIESNGKCKLFVKSEDGLVNKLVTDEDLRSVKFVDGQVVR